MASDLNAQLIAPCATFPNSDPRDGVEVSISDLFCRLLLFETYILDSVRLVEFGPLIHTLGVQNVLALLNSGALKIQLDPTQIFESGRAEGFPGFREKPPLPPGSFAFSFFRSADHNDYLIRCLRDLRSVLYGLRERDMKALDEALVRALLPVPEDSGLPASKGLHSDLRSNAPVVKQAVLQKLRAYHGRVVKPESLSLRVIPLDDTDVRVESNLDSLGISDVEEAHRLLSSAFLAVGTINSRLEDMLNCSAISGSIDSDLALHVSKVEFTATRLSRVSNQALNGDESSRLAKTFDNLLSVKRLPSFKFNVPDKSFNVEQFLYIRSTAEAVAFRKLVRDVQNASSEEIKIRTNTVRSRLGPLIHGGAGKQLRFWIPEAVGLVPFVGNYLSLGLSLIDQFILEKLVPAPDAASLFLHEQYRSLFDHAGRRKD